MSEWKWEITKQSDKINFIVKLQNYYVFLVNRLGSRQLSWYYWVSVYHFIECSFSVRFFVLFCSVRFYRFHFERIGFGFYHSSFALQVTIAIDTTSDCAVVHLWWCTPSLSTPFKHKYIWNWWFSHLANYSDFVHSIWSVESKVMHDTMP